MTHPPFPSATCREPVARPRHADADPVPPAAPRLLTGSIE